jgi:SAM-dependent methyltransferase
MISRAEAQSFDRVAADYDRLGELAWDKDSIGPWLFGVMPVSGRRALDLGGGAGRQSVVLAERFGEVDAVDLSGAMIELARSRRSRPNITYRQADLLDVGGAGRYDFVLSVMTLHHVPDLVAALRTIKTLLAPRGRVVLVDAVITRAAAPRRWLGVVPLRWRLHGLAIYQFGPRLARRGPVVAWEVYRLSTGAWLDHRVSDRFVSREEFEQACRAVFPACQVVDLGGPTRPAMIWDAPGSQGAASSWPPAVSCQSPRTLPAGSAKSATRSVPSG